MATRFYLPSSGDSPLRASNLPASAASWSNSTGFSRFRMRTVPRGSAKATVAANKASASNPADVLAVQYVSPPLQAQTITGTCRAILRAIESVATNDMRAQLVVRVMSADGGTSRGNLIAADVSALSNEFDAATLTDRKFPVNFPGGGTTVSSVAALEGDVLCVELGYRSFVATTSITGSLRLGDTVGGTDLAEDETGTLDDNPWIEFSQTLLFVNDEPMVARRRGAVPGDPFPLQANGLYGAALPRFTAAAIGTDPVAPVRGIMATRPTSTGAVGGAVPPAFLGLLSLYSPTPRSVTLVWAPLSDPAITYSVYLATNAGAENFASPTFTSAAGASGTTIAALNPNTTYYAVVRANNGVDANVIELSVSTSAFAGAVAARALGPTSIAVDWNPIADASIAYKVFLSTTPGGENFASPTVTTSAGASSATLTGLSPGQTYYVVVRTSGFASDTNVVEKSATPTAFAGATDAHAVSSTSLSVEWTALSDAAIAYKVFLSTTPGGENFASPAVTTSGGASSATLTGLSPGQTYYVVVRASGFASDTNVVEKSATLPSFAGAVSLTGVSPTSVRVAWTPLVGGSITYDVFLTTIAGAETYGSPTVTTGAGASSATLTGLSPSVTYYAVVRANGVTLDTNTVEVSGTTLANATAPVVGNFSPAEGTTITQGTAIGFDVTDDESNFRRIIVTVTTASTAAVEVAHDGESFVGRFAQLSTRTTISGGFRYSLIRQGGWAGPIQVRAYAIDHAGNEGT